MNHIVQWLTELKTPVCPDLTKYYIQINTPAGAYVGAQWAALGRTSVTFDLPAGDYVEKMCAANADGSVKEGWIERPFTVAGTPPVDPPPVTEVEPFPFPKWGDPYVPPVLAPGEVDKELWERNMAEYGRMHGDYLSTHPYNLDHIYYDMARVMYQIADYTGEPEPWNTYAKQAVGWYRDHYVLPNNGATTGYQNFTHGLRMDFERTGDVASKDAAILLSQKAAYAGDNTNRDYVVHFNRSREVAYAIMSYINAEALGEAKRSIRAEWVTQAYAHCQQWMDQTTWDAEQVAPFMMAIDAQALIEDWEETHDTRCLPTLQAMADWMWPLAWHEQTSGLLYQFNPASGNGASTTGAVDLNMLIAPWFSWLWQQTGDEKYRDQFDQLLYGFKDAYLDKGKQFDQNYWWSFDGMKWREGL